MNVNKSMKIFAVPGFLIALQVLSLSCNKGGEDPFNSPPVGKKVSINASLKDKMPLTEELDSPRRRSVFLRVGRLSDMPQKNGVPSGVDGGLSVKVQSIALMDRNNVTVTKTTAELNLASQGSECRSSKPEIRELMNNYNNLIILCDEGLNRAFSTAVKLVVTTEDRVAHEFTSWGGNWSDIGGSESVVVYSVAI